MKRNFRVKYHSSFFHDFSAFLKAGLFLAVYQLWHAMTCPFKEFSKLSGKLSFNLDFFPNWNPDAQQKYLFELTRAKNYIKVILLDWCYLVDLDLLLDLTMKMVQQLKYLAMLSFMMKDPRKNFMFSKFLHFEPYCTKFCSIFYQCQSWNK